MDNETRARIEKEAESYSNLRVWPNEVKRHCRDSYAVGAMNEHSRITELLKEERIKVIDEVVKLVFEEDGDFKQHESPASVMAKIQALKGKQQ